MGEGARGPAKPHPLQASELPGIYISDQIVYPADRAVTLLLRLSC